MKRIFLVCLLLMLLAFSGVSFAADAMTVTPYQIDGNLRVVKIEWTDTPALTMESQTLGMDNFVYGWYCFMAETKPGSAAAAPTALYDIAITNAEGTDIFGGELGDRSGTANEWAVPLVDIVYGPVLVISALTVTITNNSNAAGTGEIYLYFAK